MKQTRFRHLVALILLMCCTLGYAQTFKFGGLTYKVINASKRYVEVYSGADTETVKIPSTVTRGGVKYTVTSIEVGAFEKCYSLTSINIPSSVTSIGNSAFCECESLTSITIPNSVKSIGESAFLWCPSLTQIQVAPDNPVYDSRDNCNAIIETKSNTLIFGCASTIIPNSVTSIGNSAFGEYENLTSINIPISVTSIGNSAFDGCSNLTSINIPSSVKSIGDEAFRYCSSLTTITLPKHITNIDRLGIPKGVRIIRR